MLLIVVALVRRAGRDARIIVYVLIGLSVAGVCFDIATILREIFGWYMGAIERAKNGDKSFTMFSLFPSGNPKIVFAYSWRAAAGALGLAAAFFERRRSRSDETLLDQRCSNHALREAAVQCPSCKRFFCRECVTEHAGRMICVNCVAAVRPRENRSPQRPHPLDSHGRSWNRHRVDRFLLFGSNLGQNPSGISRRTRSLVAH